jgi:acyl-CoA synthetase (AMP-forming)/AMP-acid ligase II
MLQPSLMMDRPLLISDVIEHAAAEFGDVEIASRETHGPMFRYTYAQCAARARKLAHALRRLGLRAGNAVATLAWNNHRHLETYYGVSGSGMVIHTCNPRLHPDQLIYIVNHAEDSMMFFDRTFAPLVERIAPHCPKIRAFICLSDAANVSAVAGVDGVVCYEDWIAPHPEEFDWPQFDERTGAAICYTSGTTGHPKGALYSHRAIVLNALTSCLPGVLSLSPRDTILPAACIQAGSIAKSGRRRQA